MIITLIAVVAFVVGIMLIAKCDDFSVWSGIGCVSTVCGGIVLFICLLLILAEHVGIEERIAQNNIQYESLCERQEVINSEYEDVSKSDVIKDIAEWNSNVHGYQYWTYNPWTSWFHSKKYADSLKPIERKSNVHH